MAVTSLVQQAYSHFQPRQGFTKSTNLIHNVRKPLLHIRKVFIVLHTKGAMIGKHP